ncbi:MAG: hypothetical protein LBR92_01220 [Puniceicoccales bacterium]|jgi:hypothetical protein|nr:hypothetical protein [Puniceicoccales bacterium]
MAIGGINDFGPVNFSPANSPEAVGVIGKPGGVQPVDSEVVIGPGGDVQLGGAGVILMETETEEFAKLKEEIGKFSGSPLPLEEQMKIGTEEAMASIMQDCDSGNLSINDLAAELMILMITNALENKSAERQMRAELAQMQFQNGMKIADMIKQKGELAFQKAVTQAVTKAVTCAVDIVASKVTDHFVKKKVAVETSNEQVERNGDKLRDKSKEEKKATKEAGRLMNEGIKTCVETVGTLVSAELDLKMSQIDAQKQSAEAMGKLVDSIASSVESSIRTQEQVIQFAMGMLDKIFSLAHDSMSKITNNIGVR